MATELPLLDQVTIASPCSVPWEEMRGDQRARFCRHCQKNVYNFAEMTRSEIMELILEKEGQLCGRFHRRHDGTLLTSDCPVGLREIRSRLVRGAIGIAATILALLGGIVWGRSTAGKSLTNVNIVDEGPLTKFTNWVEPRVVYFAGDICVPDVPLSSEPDSTPEP